MERLMFSNYDKNPAWYRDVKWVSSILLIPTLAAATLMFSLASLSAETMAESVLESVLSVTLLPEGNQSGEIIAVQPDFDYTVGEPLMLLPGVEVFAEPTELDSLNAKKARERIASRLTDKAFAQGRAGVLGLLSDPTITSQLEVAFDNNLPALVRMYLEAAMMPVGLEDGTRVADWRLQAEQFPGEEVQPIVGVYVTLPPGQLASFNDRQIGEFVIDTLTTTFLREGGAAAKARVGNEELNIRLSETLSREVRDSLQGYFENMLIPRDAELAARFEQARQLIAQHEAAQASQSRLQSLTGVSGDLSPEEANSAVLNYLADLAYTGGLGEVILIVDDAQQIARLEAAKGATRLFSLESHARFVRLTWWFGSVAGLLLVVILLFSSGFFRLLNAGVFIALAALMGTLAFWQLELAVNNNPAAAPPLSLAAIGVIGYLQGLLKYLGSSLPQEAFDKLLFNHLVVLGAGLALVLLYIILQLMRTFKPKRRSFI